MLQKQFAFTLGQVGHLSLAVRVDLRRVAKPQSQHWDSVDGDRWIPHAADPVTRR